jgi:hypothetical protein
MGQIFSIGPSGSAQSRGTSIVPMMAKINEMPMAA